MTQTLEQGDPGAVGHPADRPTAGYFPTPTGADPNRIDGTALVPGLTPTLVVLVPLPRSSKVTIRALLAAVKLTPAAPLQGGTIELILSVRCDAAGLVTVDATTVTASQFDAAYNVAAAPALDAVGVTFAGLIGETYRASASAWAIGVRQ